MFHTYWGYFEEIAHQSCFSMLPRVENREDKLSAHGLFLAETVWLSLLLLLFRDPPDKAEEQAGARPDVSSWWYVVCICCLVSRGFPCQWCHTELCCHCWHYPQDAYQPSPVSPGPSGKRTAGKCLSRPDSRHLLSVNESFRCKHSAVRSACVQFWYALSLHHTQLQLSCAV